MNRPTGGEKWKFLSTILFLLKFEQQGSIDEKYHKLV